MKIRALPVLATLVVFLIAGCGGSANNSPQSVSNNGSTTSVSAQASPSSSPSPSPSASPDAIALAMANDPNLATQLVPTANQDPAIVSKEASADATQTILVGTLQSNYNTKFGQLSAKLGVTLAAPQNIQKIQFIQSQSQAGNFNLLANPISKNSAGVTSVLFQPVTYTTTVPLPSGNRSFNVSGGLMMPQGIDKTKLRGVVVYFHGTTFNKQTVGSNYATNAETQLLAEVFASQGYVVLAPDYVGQGVDWQNVHPYVLYPKVSAQTAVDMLTAVKSKIVAQYSLTSSDPALKLFSAGYSEGGSYSLWFNSYLSASPTLLDPLYTLTHSVGMEGAYSTSVVTKGYLFDNVSNFITNPFHIQTQVLANIVKPILSADAFLSYATYTLNGDVNAVFNPSFYNLDCLIQETCDVNGAHLNIAQAFALENTTIAQQLLVGGLGKSANGAIYPSLLDITLSPFNSVNSLVSSTLLTPPAQQQLLSVLQSADANLSSCADKGVSIISLMDDSVVVPNNYDTLLAAYPAKIRNAVKINQANLPVVSPFSVLVPIWVPTDHLHGPTYEFLYALNIFNSFSN